MPELITKDQCIDLVLKKPLLTNGKLNKKALNVLYRKLLKECNDLYTTKKKIQKKTMDALQFTLSRTEDIDARIHNKKIIQKYISMITPCIVRSAITENMLSLVKKTKGRFEDHIYFKNRIGSDSAFGVAYLTTGVGEGSKLVFSAKIINDNTTLEIELLERMSRAVQLHLTPNFPVIYKTLHCKEGTMKTSSSFDNQNMNAIIKSKRYYVILNELATNDMNQLLLNTYRSNIEYESIIVQALFSMRAFHKYTDHIHSDVHLGNFLYHKIKPGGYWHYRYNETDIYVPNTGFLIVLWDPGLAQKITPGTYVAPYSDFKLFYTTLKSYNDQKEINIPPSMFNILYTIIKNVAEQLHDYIAIMKQFEMKPAFKYILYEKPTNSFIINPKKPYSL